MELREFLLGVAGAVEANSYEHLCLWEEYRERRHYLWKESLEGLGTVVGSLADMPIHLSLRVDVVAGYRILFWDATSQVVDHRIIDAWFKEHLPGIRRTDAMNFHNALPDAAKAAA